MPKRQRRLIGAATAFALGLLAGCAGGPDYRRLATAASSDSCQALLTRFAERVDTAAVGDPFGHQLYRYPYLRSSRWLGATWDRQANSDAGFERGYQALEQLGRQARAVELANLPEPLRFTPAEQAQIETCISRQAAKQRQQAGFRRELRQAVRVDDDYSAVARSLGLFPLTRRVVLGRIDSWQRQWAPRFNGFAPVGEGRYYLPATGSVAALPDYATATATLPGAPPLDEQRWHQLILRHAPAWQVVEQSDADRIGRPRWRGGVPSVDSSDPVSYLLPSLTRFGGQTLLQLNYWVWFARRAPQQPGDIYAGALDGLIWRVTLRPDGAVLLYDTIHPCGCYHQLFLVDAGLRIRPQPAGIELPLIFTHRAPARELGRPLLQVNPADHYLVGIRLLPAAFQPTRYRLASYHRLRTLPDGAGSRNLFGPDGLVAGSERPERWLLWPMGVASAGAMRSWGHHAVSFANRRHFDDPGLFDTLLEWHRPQP